MRASTLLLAVTGIAFSTVLSGCSLFGSAPAKPPIDPATVHSSEGFQFRFGMPGEWYVSVAEPGLFGVGTKPLADGSTTMAVVRYGNLTIPEGDKLSPSEILKNFKNEVEASGNGGTLSDVKTTTKEIKYKKARCLSFEQRGVDNKPQGKMKMSNDGIICLHPTKTNTYMWMSLSERVAPGKELSNLSEAKKAYLDTLDFI